MRPHRLVLENFGAYRKRSEVAFDELGPLFLVWGKTGSGKTTIFDAMTYALYGRAPGSRGGLERQLWSHYAQVGDRPLVEFEYSLSGREYRVSRVPPYKRRKRGGETGDAPAEAALWILDDSGSGWRLVADKITEVDAAIEASMGLTEEEFSKIILLPQGEFQRFLEMDSTQRVAVLEKLFPVSAHDAVAQLAKERSKTALAGVQRVDGELSRLAAELAPEAETVLIEEAIRSCETLGAERAARLEELSETESRLRGARAGAERARRAAEARRRLDTLEASAQTSADRVSRIAAARTAQPLLHLLALRETAEREREAARNDLDARRAELSRLDELRPQLVEGRKRSAMLAEQVPAFDREIGELERAAEAWSRVLAARQSVSGAGSLAEAAAARVTTMAGHRARLQAELGMVAVRAEEESGVRASLEETRQRLDRANQTRRESEELARLAGAVEALESEVSSLSVKAETAAARLSAARARHDELEKRVERNSALHLARVLVEGQPCPVCGSTEHPAPARGDETEIADREASRLYLDEALQTAASAAAKLEAAAASSAAARQNRETFRGARPKLPTLEEATAAALRLEAKFQDAMQGLHMVEERRKKAERLTEELESVRKEETEAARAHALAREEVVSREAALEAVMSHAGGVDPEPLLEKARQKRLAAAQELANLQRAQSDWSEARGRMTALLSEIEGRLPALEKRLATARAEEAEGLASGGFRDLAALRDASMPLEELAVLEAAAATYDRELAAVRAEWSALGPTTGEELGAETIESLAAAALRAREAYDLVQTRLEESQAERSRLENLAAERQRLGAERSALDSRWSSLAALSALLNGELPGRRLPFKHYVLAMYFRIVVERASLRLAQLSDGRYALAADEGSSTGKGKVGLELLVRDSYTGQARSAGTLSGGERFLVALGLALGLADTIRDRSGGASLDAIFIDEGFGSLDDEALDRAISALDAVRGARIIGIVSHVAELRNRIPSRIEVTKGRGGSSLSLVG